MYSRLLFKIITVNIYYKPRFSAKIPPENLIFLYISLDFSTKKCESLNLIRHLRGGPTSPSWRPWADALRWAQRCWRLPPPWRKMRRRRRRNDRPFGSRKPVKVWWFTLPKTNTPLKMMVSNRNLLFQGFIFRCHVSFREGIIMIYWLGFETCQVVKDLFLPSTV